MYQMEQMVQDVLALNATHAGIIEVEKIEFSTDFRKMCEQNRCGKSGKNWMCPPAVGDFEALRDKARSYKYGLVFQTVHQLEDSFDFEGMAEGGEKHNKLFKSIIDLVRAKYELKDFIPLNVGACSVCKECTYKEGKPCRFPDRAIASIEAYGIDVNKLVSACNIPYNNGKNTVSYNSLILFDSVNL